MYIDKYISLHEITKYSNKSIDTNFVDYLNNDDGDKVCILCDDIFDWSNGNYLYSVDYYLLDLFRKLKSIGLEVVIYHPSFVQLSAEYKEFKLISIIVNKKQKNILNKISKDFYLNSLSYKKAIYASPLYNLYKVRKDALLIVNSINLISSDCDTLTRFVNATACNYCEVDLLNSKDYVKLTDYSYKSIVNLHYGLDGDFFNKLFKEMSNDPRICIITRNAVHGGVESLVAAESENLNADVIVSGGKNNPYNSCPFKYLYIDNYSDMIKLLNRYDICIYHYIQDWVDKALKVTEIFSIEFVHMIETTDCDKSVPNYIASHSDYILDYIRKEYKNKNLCYVPNGVDTSKYLPVKHRIHKKYIGVVTSFIEQKGISILVDAWQKVKPIYKKKYQLIIVGTGEQFEDIKNKISNDDSIILYGSTSNPLEVYDNLCLYVSASKFEGLPISILEAMSCNIPVICSDIPGHKVINDISKSFNYDEPLVLFESENRDALKEKIEYFLDHKYNVKTREIVEKCFSLKSHTDGFKKIINDKYFHNKEVK